MYIILIKLDKFYLILIKKPKKHGCFQWEQYRLRHHRVVAALMLTLGVNGPLHMETFPRSQSKPRIHFDVETPIHTQINAFYYLRIIYCYMEGQTCNVNPNKNHQSIKVLIVRKQILIPRYRVTDHLQVPY